MKPPKNTRSSARSSSSAKRSPAVNDPAKATTKPKAAAKQAKPVPATRQIVATPYSVAALGRLGVTPAALARAPEITSFLKETGGTRSAMTAMRFSQDEVIISFLATYDAVPESDRECLPFEAIGLKAGVNLNHLLGSIIQAQHAYGSNAVRNYYANSQPEVAKKRVENALKAGGNKDRDAFEIATGTLPQPGRAGVTFNQQVISGWGTTAMNEQRAIGAGSTSDDDEDVSMDPDSIDIDRLFPPAVAMQEKLIPIRNRQITDGENKGRYWTDEEREAHCRERDRVNAETSRQLDALNGRQAGSWPLPDRKPDKDF